MRFAEKKRREEEDEEENEVEESKTSTKGKKKNDDPLAKSEMFKIHEKKEEPKPVLDHFFMVSSTAFLNRNLFPAVHIEKKKILDN